MSDSAAILEIENATDLRAAKAEQLQRSRAHILGVAVDAINLELALQMILARLYNGPKGYVCAVGVHGILEALRNNLVADALAHAAICLPDGTPTVWVGRSQGHKRMSHVTGPDVMWEVFTRSEFNACTHFLYGGKPGIADQLAEKLSALNPNAKIVGTYTPPFRELTEAEEDALIARINRLRPEIVWVGIGTPRQDLFMLRILPRLNVQLMFGVGAAFDFFTGQIRMCPGWMKRLGLHWLHRLAQDPKRLWRRNLGNTAFLWHIALQISGWRSYPARSVD